MANGYSWLSYFTSFIPGLRLVDGGEIKILANLLTSASSGLTTFAGGGQASATLAPSAVNEFSVVATNGDSALLPPGIPGTEVVIINDGAASLQVYGQPINAVTGVGETIAAHNSAAQTATATGVAQATPAVGVYYCFAPGKWKQTLLT